jgi:phosphoribosylanthranilate isomerase
VRIKICGITNPEDALAAARAGADYIGLVRVPGPRQVTLELAGRIAASLPTTTRAVLLFRNAPLDEVRAAVRATGVRLLQFHGDESIEEMRELTASEPQIRVIRAFEVTGLDAGDRIRDYLVAVRNSGLSLEAVILDSPKAGTHPGYACLGAVAQGCREVFAALWLAGGLTPENVGRALASGPFDGADVSRGVEIQPGVKDQAAIAAFICRARAAGRPPGR